VSTAKQTYRRSRGLQIRQISFATQWCRESGFASDRIPITSGIAGSVARTGQPLNIADPYSQPDFNPEVDRRTGYRTRSILCMPIFDRRKEVIAVAQLLNKRGDQPFSVVAEQSFSDFALPLGLIVESCRRMTPVRATPPA